MFQSICEALERERCTGMELVHPRLAVRRLHIIWLSHFLPYPPKGGLLQRSYHLLRRVSMYHDVEVIAFNQRALLPRPEMVSTAVSALGEFCQIRAVCTIPADGTSQGHIKLLLKSWLSRKAYTIRWLIAEDMRRAVEAAARERRYDIVHVDTISLAPYHGSFREAARVLNHHNVESHMMQRRAEREANPLAGIYMRMEAAKLRRHERELCPLFDANLTCSGLDSDRLKAIVPTLRTEQVPNGVDLEYFRPEDGPVEPGSLVFVGGMGWYPNRDAMTFFAQEIWPRLCAMRKDVSMTVVGARPPDFVRALAARDPAFRVTGFVDDVRPILSRAAVYVCPVRDGGGTKLKVLDALAMGKAVVAHPVALEGLAVVPGVHVLSAKTPAEFVTAITRLLHDDLLRTRLGAAGRRLIAERYDFNAIGRRLSELYEQVWDRGRRRRVSG